MLKRVKRVYGGENETGVSLQDYLNFYQVVLGKLHTILSSSSHSPVQFFLGALSKQACHLID
jgi:hypothetical protein